LLAEAISLNCLGKLNVFRRANVIDDLLEHLAEILVSASSFL